MNFPSGAYSMRMHSGVITVKRALPTTMGFSSDRAVPSEQGCGAKEKRDFQER